MAGTSLSFSPAAAQSRYKNEVLRFGQRGVSLTDSAANLRARSRLRALDSWDLFLYTWNAGGGTGVQSNPLWAGTYGWTRGCSHSVPSGKAPHPGATTELWRCFHKLCDSIRADVGSQAWIPG